MIDDDDNNTNKPDSNTTTSNLHPTNYNSSNRHHPNSTSSTTSHKNHHPQKPTPQKSPPSLEHVVLELQKRLDTISSENRVLKVELDTVKLRYKSANDENRHLKKSSLNMQMRAEMEEE